MKQSSMVNAEQVTRSFSRFMDYSRDVLDSDMNTFQDRIQVLMSYCESDLVFSAIHEQLVDQDPVKYEEWLEERNATVSGMVGSGELKFPNNQDERIKTMYWLLREVYAEKLDVVNFSHTFFATQSRSINDSVRFFVDTVLGPLEQELTYRFDDLVMPMFPDPKDTIRLSEIDIFPIHESTNEVGAMSSTDASGEAADTIASQTAKLDALLSQHILIGSTQQEPLLGITFPEEYFQAGVNLLSYFSTYLRKNYPNDVAKVNIVQDGLMVSLSVEAKDGTVDKIEELLSDYLEGVTGSKSLDKITSSDMALLDMRQQLTQARAMIENQNMLLSYKHAEVDSLNTILLAAVSNRSVISFSPTNISNVAVNVELNNPQLHAELRSIQKYLEDQPNDESNVAGENIKKAVEAAVKGDENGVAKHLKAAGKYALDTTTKIGVPVAQAYIKDWLGMK